MQSTIGTTIRHPTEVPAQQIQGPSTGPQSLELELFENNGQPSRANVIILLNETKEAPFETDQLVVMGDDRFRAIATYVNKHVLDAGVHEMIGQSRSAFGAWAFDIFEANLPARLVRSSTQREFVEVQLLQDFKNLAALYVANGKQTPITIPQGLALFGIMTDVGSTTWNTPNGPQVSIEAATKQTCAEPNREITDVDQTLAILGRYGASLKGPFATCEGSSPGYATVISANRQTLVQVDESSSQIGQFSTFDYAGFVLCVSRAWNN